jgi:hypothetical protein
MSINIPTSITNVRHNAFFGCTNVVPYVTDLAKWCEISFGPSSANPISVGHKFVLNGQLVEDLVIPYGVTAIGNSAFAGAYSIKSITIPDSVTSIGGDAFWYCNRAKTMIIGSGVTNIGHRAFGSLGNYGNPKPVVTFMKSQQDVRSIDLYPWDLVKGTTITFRDGTSEETITL